MIDPISTTRYEAMLDDRVKDRDIFYLGDRHIARELLELGFIGTGDRELLTREEFTSRKSAAVEALTAAARGPKRLASSGFRLSPQAGCPLLQALAAREEDVRRGKLATIIYLRALNARNQEVSGYIDYLQRLQDADTMEGVFQGRAKLLPTPKDLSFFNHETEMQTSNASASFQVIADSKRGLLFKHTTDSKLISVAPDDHPGDDSFRTLLPASARSSYLQGIVFDHHVRHH